MVDWLVRALMIGAIGWVLWTVLQPQYVFVIRIHEGQPSVRKGRLTTAFLTRVAEVCHQGGVARGWIGGVRQGRRIALRFSSKFPNGYQQMLRNEWVLTDSLLPATCGKTCSR